MKSLMLFLLCMVLDRRYLTIKLSRIAKSELTRLDILNSVQINLKKLILHSLRNGCNKIVEKYYKDERQRFMFLPVDWRTSLPLDDDVIQTITPSTIQSLRSKLNLGAIDILYYTSPNFREEIENLLSSELNRLYKLFCVKNPYFKRKYNKVSFVAHSLGN